MILAALALALAQPAACPDVVTPEAFACRALRAAKAGEHEEAATAFEQAALATADSEAAKARAFAAAGNMWIAAGKAGKAALALDKALASPALIAEQRGQVQLDRARAAEMQGDLKTARRLVDTAAPSISGDPFYWYFSAALAVREGNGPLAQSAINKALSMAPADPAVLVEAGHVAQLTGDIAGARAYWMRAVAADPGGASGKAAQDALKRLPAPLTVKPDAATSG